MFREPPLQTWRDLIAVRFEHHHVAVAVNAGVSSRSGVNTAIATSGTR